MVPMGKCTNNQQITNIPGTSQHDQNVTDKKKGDVHLKSDTE